MVSTPFAWATTPFVALEPAVLRHLELLRVLTRVAPARAGYPPQRERRLRVLSTRQETNSPSCCSPSSCRFCRYPSPPPCCPDGCSFPLSIAYVFAAAVCVCGPRFQSFEIPPGVDSHRGSGEKKKSPRVSWFPPRGERLAKNKIPSPGGKHRGIRYVTDRVLLQHSPRYTPDGEGQTPQSFSRISLNLPVFEQ